MVKNENNQVEVEIITDAGSKNTNSKKVGYESEDKIRSYAALAYLVFFIPLIFAYKSKFARFHANQGLLFLIYCLVIGGLSMIPILGNIIIAPLGFLLALFFFIFGLVSSLNGRQDKLPIIGVWDLIK
jgi:uncharacterized membrane protein